MKRNSCTATDTTGLISTTEIWDQQMIIVSQSTLLNGHGKRPSERSPI
ncbi:hypothetical protein MJO29_009993 [Puccinia striiformis f. sp. tritici]|uniref:Uncharacterized protein n=1 Tax=Puccinia striiformis TaxID=27350 RepID=A0A2S4VX12_9BASI|nr:hypothetical protein MJO29_009993 [Puccinia striiformis f. sp. tritici]POW14019.1 hypothetical protein PSTT_03322 [Puccinia striiformis]